jgi:hypothetical protein
MGKNDLSSLKIKQEKKLPEETDISLLAKQKMNTSQTQEQAADKVISLRITASEFAKLIEKAGMIPIGRYLKYQLRETTDIFK